MITNELADIIVIGEGELILNAICKEEKLSQVPSIIYFENGERKINLRHSYINDLNKLPFPAYDLIDFNAYENPGLKPVAQIISTRGCPYQCINCTKIIHGNLYRKRSPENTVEEISLLIDRYKIREIHFWDDNLTLDIDRVKKICDLILKKGINKKVRFAVPAGVRADIYDEEMFSMMKKANFYLLSVAVESGVQKVIDKIGKKLDLKKVPENLGKLEKHGFRILLYFMMGFPFEDELDMKNTANFVAKLPGHHLSCFAVVPLPGSKLFEEWKTVPDFKDYTYVNYDNPIPKARSSEEEIKLKKNIRLAYLKFYSPRRILKTIRLMLKEGSFLNDLRFALKNAFKLFLIGHK
ncbi:MAG TPA: radical SAM protein [Victivallales bacterium]|mgnify:FL=1|nr:radical SAM protein [Victivallales bacterium]